MGSPLSRILIFGGRGMLATAFKTLIPTYAPGSAVTAPSRAECDITHVPSLESAFAAAKPTLVLNCAAHTKVDLCEFQRDLAAAINTVAPGHIARLAADASATLVHISTDFVFRGDSPTPYTETDPTDPLSVYGRTKRDGESRVLDAHPHALIARTSWLYGPGGPCFPATMVRAARSGKPLSVVADQHGSPTFTHDLARAILELLERAAHPGIYHITNSGQTTWHRFAVKTLELFGLPTEVTPITSEQWLERVPWSARRPAYSTLDTTKVSNALGRPMREWQEALAEYRRISDI